MIVYEFGDILLVDFPHSGSEQAKRRPALVIIDIADADVLLAPITTRERTGPGDIKIQDWQEAGLLRESWARLAKVASLEKRIVTRRLGRQSKGDVARYGRLSRGELRPRSRYHTAVSAIRCQAR